MENIITVEIVNPPENSPYTEYGIKEILTRKGVTASHGHQFTGRPVTELINNGKELIKIRTEYNFAEYEARSFIELAVEKERQLGIYHPLKTWFLIKVGNKNKTAVIQIANITPLLQALHQTDNVLKVQTPQSFVGLLISIMDIYLRVAREHELGLDLSLSNFVIDKENRLYYVDDDLYRWDNFSFLPHFIANLIRSQDWLTKNTVSTMGEKTRELLLKYFNDTHWLTVIAEELRSLFVSEDKKDLQDVFVKALYKNSTFTYKPEHTAKVIALLADPHANIEALETCLNYIEKRNISDAIILGDIVGYGPHPQECIDILRGNNHFSVIRGNHDHAVVTGKKVSGSNSVAGWTLNWTQNNIADEYREWLDSLPSYLKQDNWLAVHGSPRDKTFFNGYVYQMTYKENLDELQQRKIPLCFHGHTHIQKIYYRTKADDFMTEEQTDVIKSSRHALICPGSIGQPRNGQPGVEFAIINTETLELEFQRLPYNIEKTIAAMEARHFPAALSERLLQGK